MLLMSFVRVGVHLFRALRKYLIQRLLEGRRHFGTYGCGSHLSTQSSTRLKMRPDMRKKAAIDSPMLSGSSNHRWLCVIAVIANQNQVST